MNPYKFKLFTKSEGRGTFGKNKVHWCEATRGENAVTSPYIRIVHNLGAKISGQTKE